MCVTHVVDCLESKMHAEVTHPFDYLDYGVDVLECPLGLPLLVLSVKVAQVPVEVQRIRALKCLKDYMSVV